MVASEDRITALEQENQKLREENATLFQIIEQLNRTINRLLDRSIASK